MIMAIDPRPHTPTPEELADLFRDDDEPMVGREPLPRLDLVADWVWTGDDPEEESCPPPANAATTSASTIKAADI